VDQFTFHPYIHSFSNTRTNSDILASVAIPDVLPSIILPSSADFSFAAGDFLEVYGEEESTGKWDAILTCFFIDTAKNIIDYLSLIHRLLAPDGIWINCGGSLTPTFVIFLSHVVVNAW
jgi:carnosine N-methyltransferase